jgi:hypothetical protein
MDTLNLALLEANNMAFLRLQIMEDIANNALRGNSSLFKEHSSFARNALRITIFLVSATKNVLGAQLGISATPSASPLVRSALLESLQLLVTGRNVSGVAQGWPVQNASSQTWIPAMETA